MRNLLAEMTRYGVRIEDIQSILGCSEKTVRNKVNGITEFTYSEAERVRDNLFPNSRLEYLFATDLEISKTA